MKMFDAQQGFSFLVQQAAYIEREVYKIRYPDVQYANLIPVDTSANEWTKYITYFSQDQAGKAEWFHHEADDMPRADVNRTQHNQTIGMAGIGYGYTLEELAQAALIPGTNLTTDKAAAARRAYEEFMENLALLGDTRKGILGLFNQTAVTAIDAAAVGDVNATNAMDWENKTADQILDDVNTVLLGIYTGSLTVEMADTIVMPIASYTLIATKRIPDTTMTVLQWLMQHNVYTATTGQQLTIRAARGLEDAGDNGTGRLVAYRRSPDVVKLHLPMPHKFLPVWQTGPLRFDVPGIFRTGGVEVRRPSGMRYMDGIITPGTD